MNNNFYVAEEENPETLTGTFIALYPSRLAILVNLDNIGSSSIPISCIDDIRMNGDSICDYRLKKGNVIELDIARWFAKKQGWSID